MTGSNGSVSQALRSPTGLVSKCPANARRGPTPAPRRSQTRLVRGSGPTWRTPTRPIDPMRSASSDAMTDSSPGGLLLGVATRSRASSRRSLARRYDLGEEGSSQPGVERGGHRAARPNSRSAVPPMIATRSSVSSPGRCRAGSDVISTYGAAGSDAGRSEPHMQRPGPKASTIMRVVAARSS